MVRSDNKNLFKYKLLRAFRWAIIVGLTIIFVVMGLLEYKHDEQGQISDIKVLGNIFGNRSVAALVFKDVDSAKKNLSSARFHHAIDLICLYSVTGELFTEYEVHSSKHICTPWGAGPGREKVWVDTTMSNLTISQSIIDQGEVLGHIIIYSNKREIFNSILKFGLALLIIFVFLWIITTYMAKRILSKLLIPLEELSSTAKDIAFNQLYETRAIKRSEDEIGELVDAFNQMLDSIAEENKALIESEARFRTLTDSSPVGIFQKDTRGRMLYANDRWFDITGLNHEAFDDFSSHILETYKRQYENVWKNISERSGTLINEFGYKSPNSNVVQAFMEYVSNLYDQEGNTVGYIGTLLEVTELKNAQLELEKLAFYDPLTNLPNRRFFRDHLNYIIADAKRNKSNLGILMLDLDNFKKVNDSLGHDTGDELLKVIAERMQAEIPESCVLSRMGGDEFLFLVLDAGADEIALLGQQILETIINPIDIGGHIFEISGSVGAAIYPDDGVTSHDLIKNVDMALYNAKDKGRNQVSFYSKELDLLIKENMRLEVKLLNAINNNLLEVYIQPFYSSQENKLVWAEALLRWQDEDEGFIPPSRFIPLAESMGIIHRLGRFVVEQVCYHLSKNGSQLSKLGINGISINLSAIEFFSKNFLSGIKKVFKEYDLDPVKVDFEITESIVMGDTEMAIRVMHELRDLGCSLSIDDFGTGYSSLAYLKKFPITTLKIDQSFVKDIPYDKNDIEICTAIIAMAHKLGLKVVAEGVETSAQRDFLIDQGCELLQGYLFARPESIEKIVKRGGDAKLHVVNK